MPLLRGRQNPPALNHRYRPVPFAVLVCWKINFPVCVLQATALYPIVSPIMAGRELIHLANAQRTLPLEDNRAPIFAPRSRSQQGEAGERGESRRW